MASEETIRPDGDQGERNEWSRSTPSGDHYTFVDEIEHNDETDYLFIEYTSGEDIAIGVWMEDYDYNAKSVGINWGLYSHEYATNPETSNPWEVEELDEVGFCMNVNTDDLYEEAFTLGNPQDIPNDATIDSLTVYIYAKVYNAGRGTYRHMVTQCYATIAYTAGGIPATAYAGRNIRRRIRHFPSGSVVKL